MRVCLLFLKNWGEIDSGLMEFLVEFDLFSWFFSGLDAWQWQIKNKKLINKGTGREYSYDTSKQGYDLGNDHIIEERYIDDYLKTAQDKWKFCQENNDSFKIKCKTTGSFLKANYDVDVDRTTSGNLSLLPKNLNPTHRIDLDIKPGHQRLVQHERKHP